MSDHGPLIGAGVTIITLIGGLFAVQGAFDERTSAYFVQYWPTCVFSSGIATFLFVGIMLLQSAKRALPPWKVFIGHVMVITLLAAAGPVIEYSYISKEPKVADPIIIGVVVAFAGSVFVMSVDEYIIQKQRDGTLLPLIIRTVGGTLGRLAPVSHTAIPVVVDPNLPHSTTVVRTSVNTVRVDNGGSDAAARERIDNLAFGPDKPAVGDGGNADNLGNRSSGQHRVIQAGGQTNNRPPNERSTSDGG